MLILISKIDAIKQNRRVQADNWRTDRQGKTDGRTDGRTDRRTWLNRLGCWSWSSIYILYRV